MVDNSICPKQQTLIGELGISTLFPLFFFDGPLCLSFHLTFTALTLLSTRAFFPTKSAGESGQHVNQVHCRAIWNLLEIMSYELCDNLLIRKGSCPLS